MQIKKRFIWLNILFCVITLGFYGIYWFYTLTEDSNKISPEHATASGGKAILLSIVTLGIYGYYWHYKLGLKTYRQFRSGAMELFLCIIGLGFLNFILCQTEINTYAEIPDNIPKKRNIALSIFLSFITLGVYYLYWRLSIIEESNTICPEIKLPNADTCHTLSLVTLHIYSLYWGYKVAKRLGLNASLCVFLNIFAEIVTLAIAQNKINKEYAVERIKGV